MKWIITMASKNKSNVIAINNNPKYIQTKIKNDFTETFSTGTLGYSEIEGDNMRNDYITRPEFVEHQKHMDTRFNAIEKQIDNLEKSIGKDIKVAINGIKEEINKEKVTTKRFWIGVSIPAIISIIGIIVQFF